jgi:colicin import membrane protein
MTSRFARIGLAASVAVLLVACQDRGGERQSQQGSQSQAGREQLAGGQQPSQAGGSQASGSGSEATGTGSTGSTGSTGTATGSTGSGQAQGTTGQQATAQAKTVSGEVVRADEKQLVLKADGQEELKLTIGPDTDILIQGREGSVTEIQQGTQVRASYDESGGQPRATRVEVQESR